MDGIRVVKTTLSVCWVRPLYHSSGNLSIDSNIQSPLEKDYDLDDVNAKGTFNRSSLHIVKASDMVEPVGWYPGRLYYLVTKGLSVGIFHELLVLMLYCLFMPLTSRDIGWRSIAPLTRFPNSADLEGSYQNMGRSLSD